MNEVEKRTKWKRVEEERKKGVKRVKHGGNKTIFIA